MTQGDGLSAAADAVLREAIEVDSHRAALLEWLDELNQEYGHPTPEDYAAADLLDEAGFGGQRRAARLSEA